MWQSKGIDDDHLVEVDIQGDDDEQKKVIRNAKISIYLNIAACNIKSKGFETAVKACEEVFKLEPDHPRALYRRARALALPINSGVPEFRKALADLKQLLKLKPKDFKMSPVTKEITRLEKLVKVNSKREHDTYSKMFKPRKQSVNDFVEENTPKLAKVKTYEEREIDADMAKMREEVEAQCEKALENFSFGVKDDWRDYHCPEVDDLDSAAEGILEGYRLLKRAGKFVEAKEYREKLV